MKVVLLAVALLLAAPTPFHNVSVCEARMRSNEHCYRLGYWDGFYGRDMNVLASWSAYEAMQYRNGYADGTADRP